MIARILRNVTMAIGAVVLVCGCQSNSARREPARGDHRQDQAKRATERVGRRGAQRPMDMNDRADQQVIDQPRP